MRYTLALVAFIIIICIGSCKQKPIFICNMLGEYVDISPKVFRHELVPIPYKGKIDTVMKVKNMLVQNVSASQLNIILQTYKDSIRTISQVEYEYSYFINDRPIDVFALTVLDTNGDSVILFLRKDASELLLPLSTNSWVQD